MNNLSTQEEVERLAEFMGWKLSDKCLTCDGTGTREYETGDTLDGRDCPWCGGTGKRPTYIVDNKYWNPYTSWEDWRQVEEKVMEDEELFDKFTTQLVACQPHCLENTQDWLLLYARSSLEIRCKALISILSEQDE